MSDHDTARLLMAAVDLAMVDVCSGGTNHEEAAEALMGAGALFIALLPESEWGDVIDRLRQDMLRNVGYHAKRLEDAGIALSRAQRQ